RSLLAARDGTLWINTGSTVARLKDGALTEIPAPGSLAYENLVEDREGQIFVAIPELKRFCLVRMSALECSDAQGLIDAGARLFEDSKGNLWAGSFLGVARLKPGPPRLFPLPRQRNGYLGLAEENGAVLAAVPEGVARIVGGKTNVVYRSPPGIKLVPGNELLRDRDGGLWMAVQGV